MTDAPIREALRAACEQHYGDQWDHMFPAEQRGAMTLMAADVGAFLRALPQGTTILSDVPRDPFRDGATGWSWETWIGRDLAAALARAAEGER